MIQPLHLYVLIGQSGNGKSWLGNRIQLALELQQNQITPDSLKKLQTSHRNFTPQFQEDSQIMAKLFPSNDLGIQHVFSHQNCILIESTPLGQIEKLSMLNSAQRIYETIMAHSFVIPQFIYIINASNQFEGDILHAYSFFQRLIPQAQLNIYLNERGGQIENMQQTILQTYKDKQNLYNKLLQSDNIIDFIRTSPIWIRQDILPQNYQIGFTQFIENNHFLQNKQINPQNKQINPQNQQINPQNQQINPQNQQINPQNQQTIQIQYNENQQINQQEKYVEKRVEKINVYIYGFSEQEIKTLKDELKKMNIEISSKFSQQDQIWLCYINIKSLKSFWGLGDSLEKKISLIHQKLQSLVCFYSNDQQESTKYKAKYQGIKIVSQQQSPETLRNWSIQNIQEGKQILFKDLIGILNDF